MTMRIQFNNPETLAKIKSMNMLGSSLPFKPNIKTGEISSSTQGSSLYTIPGIIQIKSDMNNSYSHRFEIKVLANETNSAEINIPRKYYFYEGAVPSYLPISKQLFQGYDPQVTIKGKDSDKLSVIFIEKLDTVFTNKTLPLKIELIYHLDEGLFLILDDKNIVTIFEYSASINEKTATIKIIYSKQMPQ